MLTHSSKISTLKQVIPESTVISGHFRKKTNCTMRISVKNRTKHVTISQTRGPLVQPTLVPTDIHSRDIFHFLLETRHLHTFADFDLIYCIVAILFSMRMCMAHLPITYFSGCVITTLSPLFYSLSTPFPLAIDYQIIPFQGHLRLSSKSIFMAAPVILDQASFFGFTEFFR